jgi:hypothetical protein
MKLDFVFENESSKAEYNEEKKLIIATYKGVVHYEQSVQWFENVLQYTSDHQVRGIAFNCMEMKGTFTKLNSWINENFYPPMIKQGYICWSLATTDIFTKYAASLLINTLTPKEIKVKIFGNMDSVLNWIVPYLKEN